jgi:hypothetical protein
MPSHAFVVTVEIPDLCQAYVVIANNSMEATSIIDQKVRKTPNEQVVFRAQWDDGVAQAIGVSLSQYGAYAPLSFVWAN